MSITSHAFGRVTLTGKDAERFEHQVRYGRANAESKHAVSKGVKLDSELNKNGSVVVRLSSKKK